MYRIIMISLLLAGSVRSAVLGPSVLIGSGGLTTYHAGFPKVEEYGNKFYLHYAANDYDKMLVGPTAPCPDTGTPEFIFIWTATALSCGSCICLRING